MPRRARQEREAASPSGCEEGAGKLSGAGSDAGPIDCPGGWRHRAPSALRRRRTGVLSSPQVLLLGALMLVLGSHAFVFTGMRPRDDAAWALLNSQRHRAGWTGGVQSWSPLDQPSKATVVWSSKGTGGSTAFKNKRRWRDGDELDDVRSLAAIEDQLNNHHSLPLNTTTCRAALKACWRLQSPERALRIVDGLRQGSGGGPVDKECYALAIDTCARRNQYMHAERLLHDMQRSGVLPDATLWASVMGACQRAGEGHRVLELRKAMEESGVGLTGAVYGHVIAACLGNKDFAHAMQTVRAVLGGGNHGVELEERVISALMTELAQAGHWQDGVEVVELLRAQSSSPLLSVGVYNKAIEACTPDGEWQTALRLLTAMENDGLEADESSYAGAMNACKAAGDLDAIFKVLDLLELHMLLPQEQDPSPQTSGQASWSVGLYALALCACLEQEAWDVLPFVLKRMEARHLKADARFFDHLIRLLGGDGRPGPFLSKRLLAVPHKNAQGEAARLVVFNTAIHACAGGGDWRHALELLEEMKKEGLSPDYHSYTAAMLACQRAGEWQTVLSLLQRMEALGFPITTEAYGVVMAACVRSKDWDQVPQVLLTMEAAGVSPDHQFVEVLMKQLAAEGQWRTAIKVIEVLNEGPPGHEGRWSPYAALGDRQNNVVYNLGIKACAQAKQWKAATQLLADMRKRGRRPDLFSFNTALEACSASGQVDAIVRLLHVMEDQRVVPSLYSFIVSVIACLQASAWDSLPEVLGLMERCGTDVDERFFRVLMQKCKSEGLWREAINLLHVIRRSGKASQLFSKMAIHACTAAGEWRAPSHLLTEMRREGQEPDEECYASIMSAANARGHKANLLQLYHDMRAHNLLPSRGAYSMVVAACLDLKQWDAMDKILHEMREIAQYKIDEQFFRDLLSDFVSQARWRSALRLVRVLRSEDKATLGMYEQALSACAAAGQGSAAVELLEEMSSGSPLPSTYCYNLAMEACTKQQDVGKVVELRRQMQRAGVAMDVVTCNTLLNALAGKRRWEDALAFLQRMPQMNITPNQVSYNTAMKACATGKRWREAVSLLNAMLAQGLRPDGVSYRTVMNACIEGGEWQHALKILQRMRDDGLQWDLTTYNVAIKACAVGGAADRAWELFRQMQGAGLEPELRTYTTLMDAWINAGHADKALQVLDEMGAAGLQPDTYALTVAIKACGACGRLDQAVELMERILSNSRVSGEVVGSITLNLAMQVCVDNHDAATALSLFALMKDQHQSGALLQGPNWITYTLVLHVLAEQQQWPALTTLLLEVLDRLTTEQEVKATDRAAAQTHAQHVKDHLQAPHNTPAPPAQETQDQASVSLRPNSGGAAFFASAMQKIVAAQEWDVALHLYGRLLQPLTEAQQNGEERGSQWVRGIVTPPLLHGLVAALWQGDDQDRDQAQQLVQWMNEEGMIGEMGHYLGVLDKAYNSGTSQAYARLLEYRTPQGQRRHSHHQGSGLQHGGEQGQRPQRRRTRRHRDDQGQ